MEQLKKLYAKIGDTAKYEEMKDKLANPTPSQSSSESSTSTASTSQQTAGMSGSSSAGNSGTVEIPLQRSGGVYILEVSVNGQKLKDAVYDTGASSFNLSATEALFLLKQGYLKEEDFRGTSGREREAITAMVAFSRILLIFVELKVGSEVFKDVRPRLCTTLVRPTFRAKRIAAI